MILAPGEMYPCPVHTARVTPPARQASRPWPAPLRGEDFLTKALQSDYMREGRKQPARAPVSDALHSLEVCMFEMKPEHGDDDQKEMNYDDEEAGSGGEETVEVEEEIEETVVEEEPAEAPPAPARPARKAPRKKKARKAPRRKARTKKKKGGKKKGGKKKAGKKKRGGKRAKGKKRRKRR